MYLENQNYSDPDVGNESSSVIWPVVGIGLLIGAAWWIHRQKQDGLYHPPDSAPMRASRQRHKHGRVVTGRTVTIARPRAEIYAFWRDFSNLPKFMENIHSVSSSDDNTDSWSIAAPAGRTIEVRTRITDDRENEKIAWCSVEESDIETRGNVTFRDAPGERGTEVAVSIDYRPPAGELGRWIAKLFQREPAIQARRELKRLKMLLETGEIATSHNYKTTS